MSHFTVLVIGDDYEKQLEPYDENIEVEPYKKHLDADDVDRMREHYEVPKDAPLKDLVRHMPDWVGSEGGVDEKGLYRLSTYNPKSKWDWYSIGGRWTGFFKLKPGAKGVVGEPGLMTSPAKAGYADHCHKRDIDFEGMFEESAQKASARYDEKMQGLEFGWENWTAVLERFGQDHLESARAEYHAQFQVRKLKSRDIWYRYDDYNCSREEYVAKHRVSAVSTFAVVKDGVWYEKGRMGWFACVADEKDQKIWNKEFEDILKSVDGDTLLTVVDCHI